MFKRKKNEKGEELENAYDVFMRNYKTVPGFKAVVKLGGYTLFIGIILILAATVKPEPSTSKKEETEKTTTTTTAAKVTYGDILNKLTENGRRYNITVKVDGATYVIEETLNDGVLTGYLDSLEGIKKFKIEKNNIYETSLETQTLNNELFSALDKDFIIMSNLVNVLKSNKSIKELEDNFTIYTHNVKKNNINYVIKTYISSEKCNKIKINSNTHEYLIIIT